MPVFIRDVEVVVDEPEPDATTTATATATATVPPARTGARVPAEELQRAVADIEGRRRRLVAD